MHHITSVQRILRAVSLVGQLGFCVITPPLVLLYLADLLQKRVGLGVWVSIAAIVLGLLTAAGSVRSVILKAISSEKKKQNTKHTVGFNRHI